MRRPPSPRRLLLGLAGLVAAGGCAPAHPSHPAPAAPAAAGRAPRATPPARTGNLSHACERRLAEKAARTLEVRLSNGLLVSIVQAPHATEASIETTYEGGFLGGPPHVAHLVEHGMFEDLPGVGNWRRFADRRHLRASGGKTFATAMRLSTTVDPEHLRDMLWAEAARMRGPDVSSRAVIERQRRIITQELLVHAHARRSAAGSTREKIFQTLQLAFGQDAAPFDPLPVQPITPREVQAYVDHWIRPNRAHLRVTSPFPPQQVLDWIRCEFEAIPAGPDGPAPGRRAARHVQHDAGSRIGCVEGDEAQATVVLAWRARDGDPRRWQVWAYALGPLDETPQLPWLPLFGATSIGSEPGVLFAKIRLSPQTEVQRTNIASNLARTARRRLADAVRRYPLDRLRADARAEAFLSALSTVCSEAGPPALDPAPLVPWILDRLEAPDVQVVALPKGETCPP